MEPALYQLIHAGLVNDVEEVLQVKSREFFLDHIGSYMNQFIGLASRHGSIDMLEHCINYGIEVKIGNTYGLHALVGAASQGQDHIVKWLLEPWIRDGRTVDGKKHCYKFNLPEYWLFPSLHKAIQNKHVSTVKLLVQDAWASVNACDDDNLRPIHIAADKVDKDNSEQMSRYEEILVILLNAGARVNDANPLTGMTPLYDAVSRNSCEATIKLIDRGANVFTELDENMTTVLHTAAAAGFHESLCTILEHHRFCRKDPRAFDKKNMHGKTPLYQAAEGGHVECIRILIKTGSYLASKSVDRMTVMETIFRCVPYPVDFLTEILDEQVSETDKTGNEVILDYKILKSNQNPKHQDIVSDTEITSALIRAVRGNVEHAAIFRHPLVASFIYLRRRIIKPYEIFFFALELARACLTSGPIMYPIQIKKHLWYQLPIFCGFEFDNIS